MNELQQDPDNNDQYEAAKNIIREEYLVMQLMFKADPKRYGSLVANIQNNYISGQDKYP
jgi:hypothetical protein